MEVIHIQEDKRKVVRLLRRYGYRIFDTVAGENSGDLIFVHDNAFNVDEDQSS